MAEGLPEKIIGWDLGGAHLKAALVRPPGRLLDALQLPCPLWEGLEHLDRAVETVLRAWGMGSGHAVTMTAELADLFPDRMSGVNAIVERLKRLLPEAQTRLFAGSHGLVPVTRAAQMWMRIASANWFASARYAAQRVDQALWIDIGSTTTDLVPIRDGRVLNGGTSDAERLQCGELVYTGVVRTPVCAVTDRAPFVGEWQTLTAELFANMGDVYRLLGQLPAEAEPSDTCDGRAKTAAASAARLARMLGRDARPEELGAWRHVAAHVARRQGERIRDAFDRIISRRMLDEDAALVGAGAGAFLARRLAREVERPYVDFFTLCDVDPNRAAQASQCAPAVAVAFLAM
jgi:probable H4MPT-linked C1 transfer pathway protein